MQDYRDDYYEARLAQIERKRRRARFWGILSIVVPHYRVCSSPINMVLHWLIPTRSSECNSISPTCYIRNRWKRLA